MSYVHNDGEHRMIFDEAISGKVSFAELGFDKEFAAVEGGFIRMRFDFGQISENDYFKVPTIELAYTDNLDDSHWICEFNGEKIVDKNDHSGTSTVILLSKSKLTDNLQHHDNTLLIHGEFPESFSFDFDKCFIQFFK